MECDRQGCLNDTGLMTIWWLEGLQHGERRILKDGCEINICAVHRMWPEDLDRPGVCFHQCCLVGGLQMGKAYQEEEKENRTASAHQDGQDQQGSCDGEYREWSLCGILEKLEPGNGIRS